MQFDAHEFLLYIFDHLNSNWYRVSLECEIICGSCQTCKSEAVADNWTLLYDTETSFGDALLSLNKEILSLNCEECGTTTRHLKNVKITPPLLWCFQFPKVQKQSQNVLLPTEFEYQTDTHRYTYCLVSVVVHITLDKDMGHYITFAHNDKKVQNKLKKAKSLDSLKSMKSSKSLDSMRNCLSNVDVSCTFSNKAKFIKCDDDEITDLTGNELYRNLALPRHHLYLVWYQMIGSVEKEFGEPNNKSPVN
eukprot:NODE_77_length_23338_cov_0.319463.p7 type:complete len:249 gc:universal NODE_77_length_23338_cov_0.319463:16276-15530(-)